MKKINLTTALMLLSICALLTACSSEDEDIFAFNNQNVLQDTNTHKTMNIVDREELRSRMDPDMSEVILVPDGNENLRNTTVSEVNFNEFMQSVRQVSGSNVAPVVIPSGGRWEEGETDLHKIRIDPLKYRFDANVKEGMLENAEEIPDNLPDDVFIAKSRTMMTALNVLPSESQACMVRNLMVASRPTKIGGVLVNPSLEDKLVVRPFTKKVFFFREVGGIHVALNKLVFTYRLDGEFLTMAGRWVKIDYENSKLSSEISPEEFTDTMLDRLVEEQVHPDMVEEIRLSTFYRAVEYRPGKYILDLFGKARVVREGMEGMGKIKEYVVDI